MGERTGSGVARRHGRMVRRADERMLSPALCEPAARAKWGQVPPVDAAGRRMAARAFEPPGVGRTVALPDVTGGEPRAGMRALADPLGAGPVVERVVSTPAGTTVGLAVWWGMATLAQQLAKANAGQATARHALERENDRLVAELADAAAGIARQADEHAHAIRRIRWVIYGLSLAVAALGALLLVLTPIATISRPGT